MWQHIRPKFKRKYINIFKSRNNLNFRSKIAKHLSSSAKSLVNYQWIVTKSIQYDVLWADVNNDKSTSLTR